MPKQRADDTKLRELVLYIATASEGDEPFGKVKLNKILFFADFEAYRRFGRSITGHEYQKLAQGPAPRALLPLFPGLCKPALPDDNLAVRVNDYYGRNQERPFALRVPNTKKFAPEELRLVDDLVKKFWGRNAAAMSGRSHLFVGWQVAKLGETIPYHQALIGMRLPGVEQQRIGASLEPWAKACLAAAS
jgi:hypothetical protein